MAATRQRRPTTASSKAKKSARRTAGDQTPNPHVALASLSLHAARCWSSTATPSPIAHIMRCRKPFAAATARAAGAIVGFANFLLRFYADERPRAVIVGWDSLDAPTKRHEMFPAYQSGREFDEELIEQLNVLPDLSPPLGLRTPKPQASKQTTFSPPQSPLRSVQAAPHLWPVAIGIFSARLTAHDDPLPVAGWRTRAHRARRGPATIWR